MFDKIEQVPDAQFCTNKVFINNKETICKGFIQVMQRTQYEILCQCNDCRKEVKYSRSIDGLWRINKGWQDENRTYTNIERVYSTRIDCKLKQREAA